MVFYQLQSFSVKLNKNKESEIMDTIIFPGDLFLSRATKGKINVTCSHDPNSFASDCEVIQLLMMSQVLYIGVRGFKVMKPPRPAKSHGSNAIYLASGIDKRDGLLLQYLPPHSTTSLHYHAATSEVFHLLAGSAMISTPWNENLDFAKRRSVTIKPFTVHQVRTESQDSLILLEMIFGSDIVGMNDHFYADSEANLDIYSKGTYPASDLSNYHAYRFVMDGVTCESMEGFLQSLKAKDIQTQLQICGLVGKAAKKRGEELNVLRTKGDNLYWQGKSIDRFSEDYQLLLDRAYGELFKVNSFQEALLASKDALLIHSIGYKDPQNTILTEAEFCSRLMRLRHSLRK